MINTKHNTKNELIKTEYFEILEHAHGKSKNTIDAKIKALHEFEKSTSFKDFKTFNKEQAINFKEHLSNKRNQRTNQPISISYFKNYIHSAKEFFGWLVKQAKYRNINVNNIEYLTVTKNDRNKALATGFQESYEIDEIISTIKTMPNSSLLEQRNKAMLSLCILTTPRISALQSARIGSIKYFKHNNTWAFVQNPNDVHTKYSKNITAFFVGNNTELYSNVLSWIKYLKQQGGRDDDYLFPRITNSFNKDNCNTLVITKDIIKSHTTIRDIFKRAFQNNNLPYYRPHSFRHTLTRLALCLKPQFLSALSQNLGHYLDSVIISSYGTTPEHKRGIILKEFPLE